MHAHNWTITGAGPLADGLRAAAPYIPSDTPITIDTDGSAGPDAWRTGQALLAPGSSRYAPYYAAFEAVEELKRTVDEGATGKVYGVFGSHRLTRDTSAADLTRDGLLPLVALALDIVTDPVARVWATNPSLLAERDAWFVHLRTQSEVLLTLEALACTEPSAGPELLIEVTAHDRVLRAEPMRQAVVVEPLGKPAQHFPWWEDLNERFLKLVINRRQAGLRNDSHRLRTVWEAIQASAASGQPVAL